MMFQSRPIPPAVQRRICELYASGMIVRDVAEEVGFGVKRTADVLRANGALTKAPDWTPAEINQVRRMLFQGLSYKSIGEALGRTEGAVRTIKKRSGIASLRRAGRPAADLSEGGDRIARHHERRQRHKLQVANLRHLLDLKRAGHSPRFTELRNPPDTAGPLSFVPASILSLTGSSAASCAEN